MELINLTGHDVALYRDSDGRRIKVFDLPRTEQVATVKDTEEIASYMSIDGASAAIQSFRIRMGEVQGLPESRPHVRLVVSRAVQLASFRKDLLSLHPEGKGFVTI